MSVWLDIVGSFIVGAMLLANVMRMNVAIAEQSYRNVLQYEAQLSAASAQEIIQADLRKAGYGVTGTAFAVADTSQLQFLADLGADGSVDTLHLTVGTPAQAAGSVNPRDRFLLRAVNGANPQQIGAGVSTLRFRYFDVDGNELTMPVSLADIRRVRLNYAVESALPVPACTTYAAAMVELDVLPKNL